MSDLPGDNQHNFSEASNGGSGAYQPTQDERTMAIIAHIGQLVGLVMPPLFFVAPLVVYLLKGQSSSYVRAHSLEALNFSITVGIAYAIVTVIGVVTLGLGFVLYALPWIWQLIWPIFASVKASKDDFYYYYPLTLRLLK